MEFVYRLEKAETVSKKYYRNHRFYYQQEDIETKRKILLWDKDVIFFPRRINGKLCFMQRIRPGIQIVAINDLKELTYEFWKNYCYNFKKHIVIDPCINKHESKYVGGGCPPIETESGWLLIYHGGRN